MGQNGGFTLVNVATGLCYCQKSSGSKTMHFANDSSSPLCDLERKDPAEDGTFALHPVGQNCLRTARRRGKDVQKIEMSTGSCGSDATRFTFVTEGPLIIDEYAASIEPGTGKKSQFIGLPFPVWDVWYKDHSGQMLTDGEHLKGDFPRTKGSQTGVGWVKEVNIDFKLAEAGPIQAINVGFQFLKDWQIKKPKRMQVLCSADGATFGNAAVFTASDMDVAPESYYKDEDGGRKVMSFQVADICPDDTTMFR